MAAPPCSGAAAAPPGGEGDAATAGNAVATTGMGSVVTTASGITSSGVGNCINSTGNSTTIVTGVQQVPGGGLPGQSFGTNVAVDSEVNAAFQRMYSGVTSVDRTCSWFRRLSESPHPRDRQLYTAFVQTLFHESRHFPKYPLHELSITAELFGQLIAKDLLVAHPPSLDLAVRCVIEAIKKGSSSKMFLFGVAALEQFIDKLPTVPLFASMIAQAGELTRTHNHYVEYAQSVIQALPMRLRNSSHVDISALSRITLPHPPAIGFRGANTNAAMPHFGAMTYQMQHGGPILKELGLGKGPDLMNMPHDMHDGADGPMAIGHGVAGLSIGGVDAGRKQFAQPGQHGDTSKLGGSAMGVQTTGAYSGVGGAQLPTTTGALLQSAGLGQVENLLNHEELTESFTSPPQWLMDQVATACNTICAANVDDKAERLRPHINAETSKWFGLYLVKSRVTKEPNLHGIFIDFIQKLEVPRLLDQVTLTTYACVNLFLKYVDNAKDSSAYRTLLKNIGLWLGCITLGKNLPLRSKYIDLKKLLFCAFEGGQLVAVLPLVCKILEGVKQSKVFKPPNPWTRAILCVLAEIHQLRNIRTNLVFEVELLFKHLNLNVSDYYAQTNYLSKLTPPVGSGDFVRPAATDGAAAAVSADRVRGVGHGLTGHMVFTGDDRSRIGSVHPRFVHGGVGGPGQHDGQQGRMLDDPAVNRLGGALGRQGGPPALGPPTGSAGAGALGPLPGDEGLNVHGTEEGMGFGLGVGVRRHDGSVGSEGFDPPGASFGNGHTLSPPWASGNSAAHQGGLGGGDEQGVGTGGKILPEEQLLQSLRSCVVISPSLAIFNLQPNLKPIVPLAVDRAIREIISAVVERSVTISCVTTRELVCKDFCMEGEEALVKRAGHLMVASLAGSLALVTCREPLRVSLTQHLRQLLQPGSIKDGADHTILEQVVQVVAADNLDLGCSLIEQAVVEKVLRDVDAAMQPALMARRQARERGVPFIDTAYVNSSRWVTDLPEPLKLRSILSDRQLQVYKDFMNLGPLKRMQQSAAVNAATNAGAGDPPHQNRILTAHAAVRALAQQQRISVHPVHSQAEQKLRGAGVTDDGHTAQVQSKAAGAPGIALVQQLQQREPLAIPLSGEVPNLEVMGKLEDCLLRIKEYLRNIFMCPPIMPSSNNWDRFSKPEGSMAVAKPVPRCSTCAVRVFACLPSNHELFGLIDAIAAIVSSSNAAHEIAPAIGHKLIKNIFEAAASTQTRTAHTSIRGVEQSGLLIETFFAVLARLGEVSEGVRKLALDVLALSGSSYANPPRRNSTTVAVGLLRYGIVEFKDYDPVLAVQIASQRPPAIYDYALTLLRQLRENHALKASDMPLTLKALADTSQPNRIPTLHGARPSPGNEGKIKLLEQFEEDKEGQPEHVIVSVAEVMREYCSSPTFVRCLPLLPLVTVQQRQLITHVFEDWIRLCCASSGGPNSGSDRTFTVRATFFQRVSHQGLLRMDEHTDRFFCVCIQKAVAKSLESCRSNNNGTDLVPSGGEETNVIASSLTNYAAKPTSASTDSMGVVRNSSVTTDGDVDTKTNRTGNNNCTDTNNGHNNSNNSNNNSNNNTNSNNTTTTTTTNNNQTTKGNGNQDIMEGQEPLDTVPLDCLAKMIVGMMQLVDPVQISPVTIFQRALGIICRLMHEESDLRYGGFTQRPYYRLLLVLLMEVTLATEKAAEPQYIPSLMSFAEHLILLSPLRLPGFSFAWLELLGHRVFLPRMIKNGRCWDVLHRLLLQHFEFLHPSLNSVRLTDGIRVLYKGTLRLLLLLLHDFPEFLCEYHFALCDVIPLNCVQLRNLILSAFPRNMKLPDPFMPNLKVDLLPEVKVSPRILTPYVVVLVRNGLKQIVDEFWRSRDNNLLPAMKDKLLLSREQALKRGCKYDIKVLNAFLLYVGTSLPGRIPGVGIPPVHTLDNESGASLDIYLYMAKELDMEGRYLLTSAIANHLRYPNFHTHYFSCLLLWLFAESKEEIIQEQITRVLLERLIVHRPHPWGLLITFIELIKNPRFNFWSCSFVSAAPEVEKLFQSVAHTCLRQGPPQQLPISQQTHQNR